MGPGLSQIFANYGAEARCSEELFYLGLPKGFVCPECAHANGYRQITTRGLLERLGTGLAIKRRAEMGRRLG